MPCKETFTWYTDKTDFIHFIEYYLFYVVYNNSKQITKLSTQSISAWL